MFIVYFSIKGERCIYSPSWHHLPLWCHLTILFPSWLKSFKLRLPLWRYVSHGWLVHKTKIIFSTFPLPDRNSAKVKSFTTTLVDFWYQMTSCFKNPCKWYCTSPTGLHEYDFPGVDKVRWLRWIYHFRGVDKVHKMVEMNNIYHFHGVDKAMCQPHQVNICIIHLSLLFLCTSNRMSILCIIVIKTTWHIKCLRHQVAEDERNHSLDGTTLMICILCTPL